jgi:hypothetical protein
MLHYLAPYLVLAGLVVLIGGIAYGGGAVGAPGAYGAAFLATLIAGAGYARWDARQHSHRR